jgi:hypothetical protein
MDDQLHANHLKDTPKSFLEMFNQYAETYMVPTGLTVSMSFGSIYSAAST